MVETPQKNEELSTAFPATLRSEAMVALSALPQNPYRWTSFPVKVNGSTVMIPDRLNHNTGLIKRGKLSDLQNHLLNCILTRHTDGFLRQEYLGRIISSDGAWVPPFVIKLLGEYVVEILRVIEANLANLNKPSYAKFLRANLDFLALTEQRVITYWDCYYRFSCKKEDYPGFRVMTFFKELIANER